MTTDVFDNLKTRIMYSESNIESIFTYIRGIDIVIKNIIATFNMLVAMLRARFTWSEPIVLTTATYSTTPIYDENITTTTVINSTNVATSATITMKLK